jgi:type I restriction enzyme M protein
MSNPTALVQKLWNYCNILRDDGLSYGDYVEQLTFLLFLKMADEQSRPPFNKPSAVPKDSAWPSLLARDGDELETHYRHVLESLVNRRACSASFSGKLRTKSRIRPSCAGSSWT